MEFADFLFGEVDDPRSVGEQGVVTGLENVLSRAEFRPALADQDAASLGVLTFVQFNAEPFRD